MADQVEIPLTVDELAEKTIDQLDEQYIKPIVERLYEELMDGRPG